METHPNTKFPVQGGRLSPITKGAAMLPIRPIAEQKPNPVARICVGYSSAV